MKIIKPTLSAFLLGLCVMAFAAQGQTGTSGNTMPNTNKAASTMSHSSAMSSDQIKAQYKNDKAKCDSMKGNSKDVCMQEAKAKHTSALADAKKDKETSKSNLNAKEDKMDAQYNVAKEKCDAMSGDAKDTCMNKAKAKYNK